MKHKLALYSSVVGVATFGVAALVFAAVSGTLLPSSDGAYVQWTPSTGSTHYSLVDETSCNTSDYVYTSTVGNRDSFGVSLSSVPDQSIITQVAVAPCASKNGSGGSNSTMNVFYRYNGVNSSDAGAYSLSGTSPTQLATTSFSGLSYVKDASATLEVGAVHSAGGKGTRLSRIAVVITYTATPAAPTSTTATVSASDVTVTWTDNSINESNFVVERSTDGVSFSSVGTVGANVTSYLDSNLAGGTYYYRVKATNANGSSNYSNVARAVVLTPPLAPSNLVAFVSSSTIVGLNWADNSNNESSFYVYRSTDGVNYANIRILGGNSTLMYDYGVTSSITYYYQVRAYNAAGFSDYSNVASITAP